MRALVFTATSLSLGIVAHVLAGGAAPTPAVVAFLAVFVLGCAQSLAGNERGVATLLLGTGVVQFGVHLALMSNSAAMPMMHLTRAILVAHSVAGVAAAVLMRVAEAGLWRVRRWLAVILRRPAAAVLPTTRLACAPRTNHASQGLILASALPQRGPPLAA